MFNPEVDKLVVLYHGAANAVSCDTISCKNASGMVYFVVYHNDAGHDTDLTVALQESTDVAAGTNAAVTATFPIWVDVDAGTSSDTLVRQTDAASYVINTGTTPGNEHLVVMQWDPAKFSDGYDCITVTGSGGDASNTCTIAAIVPSKYGGATLPSFITD
jgi:hypothetical protein